MIIRDGTPNYQEDDLRERHQVKQQVVLNKLSVIPIGSKQNQLSPYDTNRIIGFIENYKLSGLDRGLAPISPDTQAVAV